jgi:hypothetical protein
MSVRTRLFFEDGGGAAAAGWWKGAVVGGRGERAGAEPSEGGGGVEGIKGVPGGGRLSCDEASAAAVAASSARFLGAKESRGTAGAPDGGGTAEPLVSFGVFVS